MLTLESFEEAAEIVKQVTQETKLVKSSYFSELTGNKVFFKPENMQRTGAYKVRGAYYKISTLSDEERGKGLITASAGNHAQGVAYAAHKYGVKAVIVMPTTTPLIKVERTKGYGAEVILHGDVYDEACAYALELAEEAELDLVKIVPTAQPPVCKLMDYDKHRFEQSKREREMRKNQKVISLKEVQLSATIEENDVAIKAKNAIRFLQDGNKVKVSIRFRGRQIAHSDIGMKVMQDFVERTKEVSTVERRPLIEGRNMIMILAPKAEKASKAEKAAKPQPQAPQA